MENKVEYTTKVDFSFKIFEKILLFKKYNSRDEIMRVAQSIVKVARDNPSYDDETKTFYIEAFNRLNLLTFEEMKEIIEILNV